MNRWMVVAALAVAGCSAAVQEPAATSMGGQDGLQEQVVLATFTGTADFDAGTLALETHPVQGAGTNALAIDELTQVQLSTVGPIWYNEAGTLHGCTSAAPRTWGAPVRLTLRAGAPALTGLFAVINTMSLPSYGPCNAVFPAGITTSYGAFPFGSLEPVTSPTADATWTFVRPATGGTVTFQGYIVGARRVADPTWVAPAWGTTNDYRNLVKLGTKLYLPNPGAANLAIVDTTTGARTTSAALMAPAHVLSGTAAQLWAATGDAAVAPVTTWLQRLDVAAGTVQSVVLPTGMPVDLVADPTVNTRAWFIDIDPASGGPRLRSVVNTTLTALTTLLTSGAVVGLANPYSMVMTGALGGAGTIYILGTDPGFQVCTTAPGTTSRATCTAAVFAGFPAECALPAMSTLGADGKIWFVSNVTGMPPAVCVLNPLGATVTLAFTEAEATVMRSVIADATGSGWFSYLYTDPVTSGTSGRFQRFVNTGVAPAFTPTVDPLTFSAGTNAMQAVTAPNAATGGNDVWATYDTSLTTGQLGQFIYTPWPR